MSEKYECSIVKDLLPLYVEDMVSAETARYVSEHLKGCPVCKAELAKSERRDDLTTEDVERRSPPSKEDGTNPFKKAMKRARRRFESVAYAALVFLIFLGFGWTVGENLFYNSVIMPIVGIFGYYVFQWRAIYKIPILLLLIDLLVFLFQPIEIGLTDTLAWTFIYSVFTVIGMVVAFLLHCAFKKENTQ